MSTRDVKDMAGRRSFLRGAGAAVLGAAAVSRVQAASLPEAPVQASAATQPPLAPPNGRPYSPVVTLNGWTLPWRMRDGWKEFHLVAEPVVRELAPGMKANLWGYNGQSPAYPQPLVPPRPTPLPDPYGLSPAPAG